MERFRSLDLARGFTVLCIPAIHTVMLYSQPAVYDTWLGYALAFIAEGPGGQLFMTLMGIVFTFKAQHSIKNILFKAGGLLTAGYLLNVLKFIAPYSLDLLPPGVQHDLQLPEGNAAVWQMFLLGDILHFAAIALLVMFAVYQSKYYQVWAIGLTGLILFIAPVVWDSNHPTTIVNYLLQLATGQPPRVYFPLFPWLVYPLMGLAIGYGIKHTPQIIFALLRNIGLLSFIIGYAFHLWVGENFQTTFYRTYPWDTLWHIGIVLLSLCVWEWIARRYKQTAFSRLLTYCSWHITSIYIIQWILICWLLPLVGYQTLNLALTIPAIITTTFLTLLISYSFNRFRLQRMNKPK